MISIYFLKEKVQFNFAIITIFKIEKIKINIFPYLRMQQLVTLLSFGQSVQIFYENFKTMI